MKKKHPSYKLSSTKLNIINKPKLDIDMSLNIFPINFATV